MAISNLYDQLIHKLTKLSVIGLGYVGLPLAVTFSKELNVIGYDIDTSKVNSYKRGQDVTGLLRVGALSSSNIEFTTNANRLDEALFHIIAVPTPIDSSNMPDLSYLKTACETLGNHLKRGSIVVIESTVYPGVTQDFCLPILEERLVSIAPLILVLAILLSVLILVIGLIH